MAAIITHDAHLEVDAYKKHQKKKILTSFHHLPSRLKEVLLFPSLQEGDLFRRVPDKMIK